MPRFKGNEVAEIRYTPMGAKDETLYEGDPDFIPDFAEDVEQMENIDAPIAAEFEDPPRKMTKEKKDIPLPESEPIQKLTIVTGGAGFIGSHLIKELNNRGREDILLVDDLTDPRKLNNINTLKFQDYVDKSKFIEVFSFLAENKMVERIYHLGAESSRLCTDGKYLMENNYQYTCNIMDLCHLHKIPLVYASSATVYGDQHTCRPVTRSFNDKSDDYKPESYYALSKLLIDKYSRKFHLPNAKSMIIGLRYFNVIPFRWMREQFENYGYIELFEGSKEFKRDFIPVEEAVKWTINAMESRLPGVYNVGTEKERSFYDIAADILEEEFSSDESNIKYIPMPEDIAQGYQKYTLADMTNCWILEKKGNPGA
jgi:ADP-L-glycero-D-manno-heptose 6-epimerase